MIPYFLVFLVAIFFTYIGQKTYKESHLSGWICFSISIITLSSFAAFRDMSVGTDLAHYGFKYFEIAKDFTELAEYIQYIDSEYLYLIITYVSAVYIKSIKFLLYVLSVLPLYVIYHYIIKHDYKQITFALTCYLLLYFNTSLNILRQTPAIFLSVIAYKKIEKKEYIKAIIYILIASLFHSSALFMLALFPIYYLSQKKNNIKYLIIMSLAILIVFFSLDIVVKYSPYFPDLIARYLGYITSGNTNLNLKYYIFKILFGIFILYFYNYYKNNTKCKTYMYFAVLDLLFYFLSNFVKYGYRLSYYFVVYYIFFIPEIYDNIDNKKEKNLFKYGILFFMILYWIFRYVIIGYDGTIPYILG